MGNNTPVFFLRDPLKFPDLNHAVKRDPRTNLRSARNNWDFWTSLPEALYQVTITMSDRGIPCSYRHMHGFGSLTFSMINSKNERFWVKFHLVCQQGIKNLTDAEAEAIARPILDKYEWEGHPYYASARLWDDGVVDLRSTRTVLAASLACALSTPVAATRMGVLRM